MPRRSRNNTHKKEMNQLRTDLNKTLQANQRIIQATLASKSHDDKRNLYEIYGYDLTISTEMYLARFRRQDIANRIVKAYPEACWDKSVRVSDDENKDTETAFEKEFKYAINKTDLISSIRRADILAGIGQYGVLFIGVNDGVDPKLEIQKKKLKVEDILYTTPYMQNDAKVSTSDNDVNSPRFGLPLTYSITTSRDKNTSKSTSTMEVHWTRIIHIAEGKLESEIYGEPRLQSIFNRLVDLEKVVGGSAEMFWLNGRGGLNIDAPIDADMTNKDSLTAEMENFTHGLTRYLRTKGLSVNPLEFNVPNPESNVDVLLKLISGAKGIPTRILVGSESGQLASSQDENNWNKRVKERRETFCESEILRPIVDWLIEYGVLPKPLKESYEVLWPTTANVSEVDQADIAVKKANAMSSYVSSGSDAIVPEKQFVEEVLLLDFKEDNINTDSDTDDLDKIENEG